MCNLARRTCHNAYPEVTKALSWGELTPERGKRGDSKAVSTPSAVTRGRSNEMRCPQEFVRLKKASDGTYQKVTEDVSTDDFIAYTWLGNEVVAVEDRVRTRCVSCGNVHLRTAYGGASNASA